MTWFKLALLNSSRRPIRTAVTVMGVAIAMAALFSLLAFQRGYQKGMAGELDRLGAHILVVPKGCPYDAASIALHGANWPCYLKGDYLKQIRSVRGIAAAAPALMAAFYDENGKQSVYVGIDENMLALKPAWRITGKFPAAAGELLIGSDVAAKNHWTIGQEVPLPITVIGVGTASSPPLSHIYAVKEGARPPRAPPTTPSSLAGRRRGSTLKGELRSQEGSARGRAEQQARAPVLPISMEPLSLRITGILAPTQGADDTFVFLRIEDAQKLLQHSDELTHILVRLNDPENLDTVVSALRSCDAGMEMNIVPMAHLFRTIQNLVNSTRVLMGCIALVALLVAGSGVSNTILMAISERIREIGVMRALGASPMQVFRLYWMETLLLCVSGSVLGVGGAFVAAHAIESWLRARLPFAPTQSLIEWNSALALACISGAVLLGSACGLLPAWRAAKLSPITAIGGVWTSIANGRDAALRLSQNFF